jgi:hypothetical protein
MRMLRRMRTMLWRTRATMLWTRPSSGRGRRRLRCPFETNTPPPRSRSARTAAKVASPLADKRRATAASAYDPENVDAATVGRVSKQRRR